MSGDSSFFNKTGIEPADDAVTYTVNDHGELAGLSDDDHPQYHNDARGDARYYTKTQLDDPATGKANVDHNHTIGDIDDLQDTLALKLEAGHTHEIVDVEGLEDALVNRSLTGHTHAISDVTDLQTTLDSFKSFKTISVSGQSDIVADAADDTLTIVGGTGIAVTTNAGSDTLTISYAGGSAGTGSVTSVDASGGSTGLSFSGGPISASGTLTLGGTLAVGSGGTGATSLTGLIKGNGTSAMTAAVAGTDFLDPAAIGSTVQGYDADLAAIAALSGTSGLLKKTDTNTWSLDTNSYLTTSSAASSYQPLDGDLTSIAGLSGTSGFLKKTDTNTWALDTSTYLTSSSAGSLYQPLDSELTALAGLTSAADRVPYFTGSGSAALATLTSQGRTFLAASTVADQLTALGITNAKTNLVVFTSSNTYVPSANTKAILVYLTGGGGGGGAISLAGSASNLFYSAVSGTGGGTLIFSMDAIPSQTFQVVVGAGAPTTPVANGQGGTGTASTFGIILASAVTNIASAPGGLGGASASQALAQSPLASATITAPNTSYVSATSYVAIRGGYGRPAIGVYGSGSTAFACTGEGGSSFWGNGALADFKNGNTSGNFVNPGANGVHYGTGGAAASILKRTGSTALTATGGAGANGICIIMEVKG